MSGGPGFGARVLREAVERALAAAQGDETEALVVARTHALTRFANNAIHQNVAAAVAELRIRVARGRQVAAASTNRLDGAGIAAAAEQAAELARIAPEDPEWSGLPGPAPAPHAAGYAEATAGATPEARARAAARICAPAGAAGLRAAGYVATTVNEVAVANSHGIAVYHVGTVAEAEAVAVGDAGSAYANRVHGDFAALDVDAVASEAIESARRAQAPHGLAPGTYEVVLAPYAVSDIVDFLGLQLSGLAVEEGRSFVGGKLGQLVTGSQITLLDHPLDPDGLPRPFDFEGVPTERLVLIDRGVAVNVAYDSRTAARNGARNTGHALPSAAAYPLATHLRLEPGHATREELIAGVRRGVYVTRFWYTRWVHPLRTIVTGMTRDGTFAIENGELAYPVHNLRFTQSYHEALAAVVGLERGLTLQRRDLWSLDAGSTRVPAARLGAFTFTGVAPY